MGLRAHLPRNEMETVNSGGVAEEAAKGGE